MGEYDGSSEACQWTGGCHGVVMRSDGELEGCVFVLGLRLEKGGSEVRWRRLGAYDVC